MAPLKGLYMLSLQIDNKEIEKTLSICLLSMKEVF